MEPRPAADRILVGRFGAPHGVRGEMRLQSFTGDPVAIARYGPLTDKPGTRRFEIKAFRPVKDNLLIVRIADVTDRTAAERLVNTELFVSRAALPAPDAEEFYLADLIGMAALDEAGAPLGTVIAVPNYGAGDMLEIAPTAGGESLLIPFTRAAVPEIDGGGRRITVLLPDELVDPAEPR